MQFRGAAGSCSRSRILIGDKAFCLQIFCDHNVFEGRTGPYGRVAMSVRETSSTLFYLFYACETCCACTGRALNDDCAKGDRAQRADSNDGFDPHHLGLLT
jgi:hypothetical protein